MQGIALEFDANNAPIEILEQQIKELRANRSNIKQQLSTIQDELELASKKKVEIRAKFKILQQNLGLLDNHGLLDDLLYFSIKIEKFENRANKTSLLHEQIDLLLNIATINRKIDKINTIVLRNEMVRRLGEVM
jgi:septal ring factor EnvC (AmiA/AmiB activator)